MGRMTSGLAWLGYQCLFGDVFLGGAGLVPWLAAKEQRVREGFPHYLGGLPRPPAGPLVWVHGVSLGESLVACALMERLRRDWPGWRIGFTTTHPEVLALVRKKRLADVAGYFPLDFAPFLWRALARWRPRLVVIAETDLWPGLAGVCRARGVPLVLVNGRISDKHQAFWTRARALGDSLWAGFGALGVQGAADRDRLVEMGADGRTIAVLGNIKVDLVPPRREDCLEPVRVWRGADTLVVFGSLHPAEFDALVPCIVRLAGRPGMRVLVAPRAIVLAAAWERRLREAGVAAGRRSAPGGPDPAARVLLLDTIGELASLYSLAGAAFVGGTLDPAVGGHNPLEVIAHGVPLVIGPHARNFADLVADLRQAEGLAVGADPGAVERHLAGLAAGGAEARGMVARAAGVVAQHQGALARTLSLLRPFLEDC